eukprot:scaffold2591_cov417-Prasinococcus_capsulatus_cf.AAC.8
MQPVTVDREVRRTAFEGSRTKTGAYSSSTPISLRQAGFYRYERALPGLRSGTQRHASVLGRARVVADPCQHSVLVIFLCRLAGFFVDPGAAVLSCILQDEQVASTSCCRASALVPSAAIFVCIGHHMQMPVCRSLLAGFFVPLAPLLPSPPEALETAALCGGCTRPRV